MTAATPCPIARAEASLAAIFAACQARKEAKAKARQAQADKRLAQGGLWWREEGSVQEMATPPRGNAETGGNRDENL